MQILSPNQFKSLYHDEFIDNIKLYSKRSGVSVPVVFAEVLDIMGDTVLYWYDEGFSRWRLVGVQYDNSEDI